MNVPPPIPAKPPKKRRGALIAGIVSGGILILLLVGYLAVRLIIASGITKGPDAMFGDQHLKTAVALIELHKTRYGKYPDSLRDLKFIGQWDQIALQSVGYYPNVEHTAYYIEVQRGWMGKPTLEMPVEFLAWHWIFCVPETKRQMTPKHLSSPRGQGAKAFRPEVSFSSVVVRRAVTRLSPNRCLAGLHFRAHLPLEKSSRLGLSKAQRGVATQGWATLPAGTPVSNVRVVWPRWYHRAWKRIKSWFRYDAA